MRYYDDGDDDLNEGGSMHDNTVTFTEPQGKGFGSLLVFTKFSLRKKAKYQSSFNRTDTSKPP